jgi:hypothetical protein
MSGGKLICRLYEDSARARQPFKELLTNLIEADGKPFIWPRISEPEQKSFDAISMKVYCFL